MNKNTLKLKLVYLPYLLTTITLIVFLSLFKWIFSIKLHLIEVDEFMINFVIPGLLVLIIVNTALYKRLYLLRIKWKNAKGPAFYNFISGAVMLLSVVSSQFLFDKLIHDLIFVNTVNEIKNNDPGRYYSIAKMDLQKQKAIEYVDVYTSGKHNNTLNFKYYFAIPIEDKFNRHQYWYGKTYHDDISNSKSETVKEDAFKGFIDNSKMAFNNDPLIQPVYLENIPNSFSRKGYLKTLRESGYSFNEEPPFIFEPVYAPFKERYKTSLLFFLFSFGLGNLVFMAMVAKPKLDEYNLVKFQNNTLTVENDFAGMFRYLLPRKPHAETSILIDIAVVFLFYSLILGIDLFSPSGDDLYNAGAISKDAFLSGEYWRLITAMFLHSGIIHFVNNIFALAICGHLIEPYIKKYWLIASFFICGIGASLLSFMWSPYARSVGASGAIFGLYGIMIALLLRKALPLESKMMYVMILVLFGGVSLVFGVVTPNVNNSAHVWGLVLGIILGYFLPTADDENIIDEPAIYDVV